MTNRLLHPGDPAPWFTAASPSNQQYRFNTVAGRYVLMGFFGSAGHQNTQNALAKLREHRTLFDEQHLVFYGVSIDRQDQAENRIAEDLPGLRVLWDFDQALSRLYGAIDDSSAQNGNVPYKPFWLLLDPMLRCIALLPLNETEKVMRLVVGLPPKDQHAGTELTAPALILPRIFEPQLCKLLIDMYEKDGGVESGFMRDVDGKTVSIIDHSHKRRSDYEIVDDKIKQALRTRILRRVVPEIKKAFQFHATRMERYIVACYDAQTQGHFRAHRDNTTKGTAHRRFAVTINLNAEDFQGGTLSFPEFGTRQYKAPTGGAVVFSCSLMHQAAPVTKGTRYAFLPFLYDDAAAEIRARNNEFLGKDVAAYRGIEKQDGQETAG